MVSQVLLCMMGKTPDLACQGNSQSQDTQHHASCEHIHSFQGNLQSSLLYKPDSQEVLLKQSWTFRFQDPSALQIS